MQINGPLRDHVKTRIRRSGRSISSVARRAGIHPMTLYKFVWGQSVMWSNNLDKVLQALQELENGEDRDSEQGRHSRCR